MEAVVSWPAKKNVFIWSTNSDMDAVAPYSGSASARSRISRDLEDSLLARFLSWMYCSIWELTILNVRYEMERKPFIAPSTVDMEGVT